MLIQQQLQLLANHGERAVGKRSKQLCLTWWLHVSRPGKALADAAREAGLNFRSERWHAITTEQNRANKERSPN